MTHFDVSLAIGGGVILILGLTIGFVKNRLWLSEPMICLAVGALLGHGVLGWLDPGGLPVSTHTLFKEVARVTIALAVMGAALRLPRAYEIRRWRELAITLGLGMPLMWAAGTLAAWLVLPLAPLYCLLIGAVLAPTDPVLAASVVTGATAETSIPARLRRSLTAESGANDGLALLLVMLPIALLTLSGSHAWSHWFFAVLLREILGSIVLGVVIGWIAGALLRWARNLTVAESQSTLTIGISLALTLLGLLSLLGTDGILGVFVAGLVIERALPQAEQRHEHVQEAISRFFDLPVFILFGSILPFAAWYQLGWVGIGFVALILLGRRLPAWFALQRLIPSIKNRREALFAGWFGPIGVASLYYALVAVERTGVDMIWTITSLVVFGSIVAHGQTATPLTQRMGTKHRSGRAISGGR